VVVPDLPREELVPRELEPEPEPDLDPLARDEPVLDEPAREVLARVLLFRDPPPA
jgi:hypothetical protein